MWYSREEESAIYRTFFLGKYRRRRTENKIAVAAENRQAPPQHGFCAGTRGRDAQDLGAARAVLGMGATEVLIGEEQIEQHHRD